MATMETLSVTLPAEILEEVRQAIEGGDYGSKDEVFYAALQNWSVQRSLEIGNVQELRRAWAESVASGAPYVPMEEVMDRLESKYRTLAAESAQVR